MNLKKTTDDFYQISKTLLYSESLTVNKTGEVIKLGWFHKILYTHMRDQYIFCELNSNLYFESQESMAKKLCCSERNIRDGVKTLLGSSMITVKKRGKSNVYTVKDVFDKDFELSYKPNKIVKVIKENKSNTEYTPEVVSAVIEAPFRSEWIGDFDDPPF